MNIVYKDQVTKRDKKIMMFYVQKNLVNGEKIRYEGLTLEQANAVYDKLVAEGDAASMLGPWEFRPGVVEPKVVLQ
jgi:hypothetical protein